MLRCINRITLLLFVGVGVLLFLSSCSNEGSKASDERLVLLNSVIEAHGGEENLKKLARYKVIWFMGETARGVKGKDTRFIEPPSRLRVELDYVDGTGELRVVNNDEGMKAYRSEAGEVKTSIATGPQLMGMKLQRMRFIDPLSLRGKIDNLTIEEAEDGSKVILLIEDGLEGRYFVGKDSGLIERFVGTLKMGEKAMDFRTEYSDFKAMNGVMMAHVEAKFAGDVNTANLTLREVVFVEDAGETGAELFRVR
jgi:hypothetical protein